MNVLVALAWPNHVHHGRARAWFRATHENGWATCPTTEAGFVRVSSNVRVLPDARPPSECIELLARLRGLPGHAFWTDDVSPTDAAARPFTQLLGHRQVTDAHLLALAMRRAGRLATFDRGVLELAPDEELVELIP